MSGLSSNLQFARRAVQHVRKKLPRGSGNQSSSPSDGGACVGYVRSTMVCTADFIPHLAQRAIAAGCGNCGEQAAVAFMYLRSLGVRSLDYMNLYNSSGTAIHSFVVIEFGAGADDESSGWGADAVVCDPWDENQAYAATEISQKMSLFQSGCTVRSLRRDT